MIVEIVRRLTLETGENALLIDVLNESEQLQISRDVAEDIIERLNRDGTLFRPSYETLSTAR
jgi:DNA replicative helicase MCM subunit Mcm2 (Cdc46/Mcm family)